MNSDLLISIFALIGFIWLVFSIINKLIYKPIKALIILKIKEKRALEKRIKKLEFDSLQYKNDLVKLDLELKELKKVGVKK